MAKAPEGRNAVLVTPGVALRVLRALGPAETHCDDKELQAYIKSLRTVANSGEPMVMVFLKADELWVLNARRDPRCPEASESAKKKLEEATESFALNQCHSAKCEGKKRRRKVPVMGAPKRRRTKRKENRS
ncbi:MAG: hypothetical protein OEV37_04130 [Candidatus Berkelbacteria bacterium]|nr:hypothetical protein [Candidatus Berkelbacteria bacterium]